MCSEGRRKLGVSVCRLGEGLGAGEGRDPRKLPAMKLTEVCKRGGAQGLGSSDDTSGCKVSKEPPNSNACRFQ